MHRALARRPCGRIRHRWDWEQIAWRRDTITAGGMLGDYLSIENAKGSTRSGTDKAGKPWSVDMQAHYGYFTGTEGRDKDHVDVFIGPDPSGTKAFVVNQIDPATGRFDEHKVLLGYNSRQEAIEGYKANYAPGWKGLGSMVETNAASLREWLKTEDTKKPAKTEDFKPAEAATGKDSLQVAPPAIEPGTPDFRLLPKADKAEAVKAAVERRQSANKTDRHQETCGRTPGMGSPLRDWRNGCQQHAGRSWPVLNPRPQEYRLARPTPARH